MAETLISLLALLLVLVLIYVIVSKGCEALGAPAIVPQIFGLILLLIFLIRALPLVLGGSFKF